jgi:hypothetical protein
MARGDPWQSTLRGALGASCGASQCEAVYGIRRVQGIGRRCAQVVSSIRIISIAFHLFQRNEDVPPVLSTFRVDVSVYVLDFGRVAIRVIATASGGIIGHVPR